MKPNREPRTGKVRAPLGVLIVLLLAGCTQERAAPAPAAEETTTAVATAPEERPDAGTFPTFDTTGPTVPREELTAAESVVSERAGQVIEGLEITSAVKIVHDGVILRSVRINHTATKPGQYALTVDTRKDGICPSDVVVENIEIVGDPRTLVDNAKAVYSPCPVTIRDSRVYGVGTGIRIVNGVVLEGNYIRADFSTGGSDTHRSAVGLNGGAHHRIVNNDIECSGRGCSGALVMYGDFAPVDDVVVSGNLFNTTGSYCTYAGSLDSKEHPRGRNVRYIGNTFGTKFHAGCGRYGPVAGRDGGGGPGFEWRDNVWARSGKAVEL